MFIQIKEAISQEYYDEYFKASSIVSIQSQEDIKPDVTKINLTLKAPAQTTPTKKPLGSSGKGNISMENNSSNLAWSTTKRFGYGTSSSCDNLTVLSAGGESMKFGQEGSGIKIEVESPPIVFRNIHSESEMNEPITFTDSESD